MNAPCSESGNVARQPPKIKTFEGEPCYEPDTFEPTKCPHCGNTSFDEIPVDSVATTVVESRLFCGACGAEVSHWVCGLFDPEYAYTFWPPDEETFENKEKKLDGS